LAKRIKKLTIKLEQRNDWLKRFETGESASGIANTDDYDVRTVRKHIELAKQEREVKEARSSVLRNALEQHYADLRNFAESWNAEILGFTQTPTSLDNDLIESALRQHLPRSPLWAYRTKWQSLHQKYYEQEKELNNLITPAVKEDSRLLPLSGERMDSVIGGLITALNFQAKQWAGGLRGLNQRDNLLIEPKGKGKVDLRYGFAQMGVLDKEQAGEIKTLVSGVLVDLEPIVKTSEAFQALERTHKEIEPLKGKLREELAIIRLRRIVPGHCKYCPL
jgi:hypothetical protein